MSEEKPEAPPEPESKETTESHDDALELLQAKIVHWFRHDRGWFIATVIVAIVAILAGLTWFTRYSPIGLFMKKDLYVYLSEPNINQTTVGGNLILDGNGGAYNSSGGRQASGRLTGVIKLTNVPVGRHNLTIVSSFRKPIQTHITVTVGLHKRQNVGIMLPLSGHGAVLSIINSITQKPVPNPTVKYNGQALPVVANSVVYIYADSKTNDANITVSAPGYTIRTAKIALHGDSYSYNPEAAQNFNLAPAGKLYYISKATGQLNVMKSNLDGSDAQVALAATGNEQVGQMALSQSPDGKYVALVAKRNADDAQPQLYMISAADDKLASADTGNAVFTIQGWLGDSLIYTVERKDVALGQANHYKLKSYNASSGALTTLDQSSAATNSTNTAGGYEYYTNVWIAKNQVIYLKNWTSTTGYVASQDVVGGQQDTLNIVGANGSGHQTVASYPGGDNVAVVQYAPASFYIQDNANPEAFYNYTIGDSPKPIALNDDQFYGAGGLFIPSSDGNLLITTDSRDGNSILLTEDISGKQHIVNNNTGNNLPFGWYTDQYILTSLNGSEMGIFSVSGGQNAFVTNYQATSNF